MGLINFFSNGGNFGLIAKNVVCLYKCVKMSPQAKLWSDNKCLYVAGVLDLRQYLLNGSIDLDEVQRAVKLANLGVIGDLPLTHVEPPFGHHQIQNFNLKCFVMQVEYLVFCSDIQTVSYKDIVSLILQKKKTIYKVVDKTLDVSKNNKLYDLLMPSTLMTLNNPDFIELVDEYSEEQ